VQISLFEPQKNGAWGISTEVDQMRWQMGLQLNCSAADWLNSTADSFFGRWSKDGRILTDLNHPERDLDIGKMMNQD
jgi:hypothetical protein